MAATEQPLKKRKLLDPNPDPLSPEEIAWRRRNKEEIRALYESYKRIKFCVSQKNARLENEFEQAYLSLIVASRGCTSVQRIVAELIPRYASSCPTALEAAAKVSINMYNWSLGILMRGEDGDDVAYQTAKACIFGLVDICRTAAHEAPTSSVIRGICSAVFEIVLTFLTSTFEGKDISLSSRDVQKLQETPETFSDMKQELADNSDPPVQRLLRFRALSLLHIFFTFPKNLLTASFNLISRGASVAHRESGKYFLNQLTSDWNAEKVTDSLIKICDRGEMSTDLAVNGNNHLEHSSQLPNICFLKMAIDRDLSLRSWLLLTYKNLSESLKPEDLAEVLSFLEKNFGSLLEFLKQGGSLDSFDQPKHIDSLCPSKNSVQHVDHDTSIGGSSGLQGSSVGDALQKDVDAAEKDVGQSRKALRSLLGHKAVLQSGNAGEQFISIKHVDSGDPEGSYPIKPLPNNTRSNHFVPSINPSKESDMGGYHAGRVDKIQGPHIDFALQARISSGSVSNSLPSPKSTSRDRALPNHVPWCPDGDPADMDVHIASKQLWVGSIGRDASETLVRLQFEDFGSLEQFMFVPAKDFALIEYKTIMDAVKAHEYMHGSSPWGSCLHIKFLDRGSGSRGTINGIAVGESCHIFISRVPSQREKDEILHRLMIMGMRLPCSVTYFASESALLLEFGTAEEAVNGMIHIRRQRNEIARHAYPDASSTKTGCQLLVKQVDASVSDEELLNAFSRYGEITRWQFNRVGNFCLLDFRSYEFAEAAKSNLHGARFGPKSILVEFAKDSPGTISSPVCISPHTKSVRDSSFGNSRIRITQTSGYVQSHGDFYSPKADGNTMNPYRSFTYKPEHDQSHIHGLVSPRLKAENFGGQMHNMHAFHSGWPNPSSLEAMEIRPRRADEFGTGVHLDHSYAGTSTLRAQQVWQYKKQESEAQILAHGSMMGPPLTPHGGSIIPPPVPSPSFVRPLYPNPIGHWDNCSMNPSFSSNQVTPIMNPINHHNINVRPAIPFIPSSVTPLSQLTGASMQNFDNKAIVPGSSSLPPPPPPPPDSPPPLPSSPPPLPISEPPSVPPPPSSPLIRSALEPSKVQLGKASQTYLWQGTLTKSGVHYCTIYATREDTSLCNYSNAVSEPVNWPLRLDVTKRTDVRNVMTTFASTQPHRREVCRLMPSTTTDNKGFQDFILYLRQRGCAGVIKIPAGKFMWARLLFILPHSQDTCSSFGISSHPTDCLLALILPKDTSTEAG